jgi:cellulose synthase/poly-beta-1,6-N-acetylglucosamine synthase-like glycosyltransferase
LLICYLKSKKNDELLIANKIITFPKVTIQLPVFNEMYVVERLIDSVMLIKWPKDRLEIQILDDSNDQTTVLIKRKIAKYIENGFCVKHIIRDNRSGFKAGALANGLLISSGEYVAIFDSDFMPKPNFLNETISHFNDAQVGVVQTKWTHLNSNYSLLTKLQNFGLNNHFNVEQTGRNSAGYFINFNGTAGIWRKKCIEDSGGWQSDTLTEDLDLSYRAQLKGWKFVYRKDILSPSELPITIEALKSQQYRWSKGAAECSRKNLNPVLFNQSISLSEKLNAFFHLNNSVLYLAMVLLLIFSIPLIYISKDRLLYDSLLIINYVFSISTLIFALVYFISNYKKNQFLKSVFEFIYLFPLFLSFCLGISVYVSLGVIKGFLKIKSSFIRTPKFNVVGNGKPKNLSYKPKTNNLFFLIELSVMCYCVLGIFISLKFDVYTFILFLIMFVFGSFLSIFYYVKHVFFKKI